MDAYSAHELRRVNDRIDALVQRVVGLEQALEKLTEKVDTMYRAQFQALEAQRGLLEIVREMSRGQRLVE